MRGPPGPLIVRKSWGRSTLTFKLGVGVAIGVDWSGAKNAHRKIWAARLACRGDQGDVEWVDRPFEQRLSRPFGRDTIRRIVDDFAGWLNEQEFDVAGLDFCFGLAAEHMKKLGLSTAGPASVGAQLLARYSNADVFRLDVGQEKRRATDLESQSPFCPTNLRMYRQTFWGLRALAKCALPTPPWPATGPRAVVEVLPKKVLRQLRVSSKTTADDRRLAVQALEDHGVAIEASDREIIVADREGDALDAVLAAMAAAGARYNRFNGAGATAAATGEGWIYSA
jgi:hypothetical protein